MNGTGTAVHWSPLPQSNVRISRLIDHIARNTFWEEMHAILAGLGLGIQGRVYSIAFNRPVEVHQVLGRHTLSAKARRLERRSTSLENGGQFGADLARSTHAKLREWRLGPTFADRPSCFVFEPMRMGEMTYICGGSAETTVAIGTIGAEPLESYAPGTEMCSNLYTLVSACCRHLESRAGRPDPSLSLASLEEIELAFHAHRSHFSRREAQVCARILYGISTLGIALDLKIGTETVVTYRKRAYQRLGMSTQRELLLWYLKVWSEAHARAGGPPAPSAPARASVRRRGASGRSKPHQSSLEQLGLLRSESRDLMGPSPMMDWA